MMIKTTNVHGRHDRQAGLSLIEALIALVVLSIGLLGLASLQINSLKFNQTAHLRTQASQLAYRMLDTLRASPNSATNANTKFVTDYGTYTLTGSTVAETEVAAWKTDLENQLPLGDGKICRVVDAGKPDTCSNTGNENFFTVTVRWNEANDPKAARDQQEFQLISQVAATPIP